MITSDSTSALAEVSEARPNRTALKTWTRVYPHMAEDFTDPQTLIQRYHSAVYDSREEERDQKTVIKAALSQIYNINDIPPDSDSVFVPR